MVRWRDVALVVVVVAQLATLAMVAHAYYKAHEVINAWRSAFTPPATPATSAAVLGGRTTTTDARTTEPSAWQYITITPPDDAFDRTMNRLGGEGWELVSSRRATTSSGRVAYEVILRRLRRSDQRETTSEAEQLNALQDESEVLKEDRDRVAAAAEEHRIAAEKANEAATATSSRRGDNPEKYRGTLKGGNLAATATH